MEPIARHDLIFPIQILILFVLSRSLGEIFRFLKQPPVVGEILAGIILGPTVFGNIAPRLFSILFHTQSSQPQMLEAISWLGGILFLLAAGMEMDINAVRRRGRAAFMTGLIGIILPFTLGFSLGFLLPSALIYSQQRILPGLFLGTALSVTALPIIVKILLDLKLLRTDVGFTIVSSAFFMDLVVWTTFSILLGLMSGGGINLTNIYMVIILIFIFFLACLTVGKWVISKLLSWAKDNLPWPSGILTIAIGTALLSGAIAQWIGIHAFIGSFIAGIMLRDSLNLEERAKETIFEFAMSIFAPLFFATVGLRVDFLAHFNFGLVFAILIIYYSGKIAGCGLGAILGGMSREDALCISVGMTATGGAEVFMALLALRFNLIKEQLFVALVVMAMITSLMNGSLIKWSFGRKKTFTMKASSLDEATSK